MFFQRVILGMVILIVVKGFTWDDLKDNEVDKLTTVLQQEDNVNFDDIDLLINRLETNKANLLNPENKLWKEDKDTPNIDNSDKTSHALAVFLTYNPFSSCRDKYLVDMKQFISCVREFDENIQIHSKRGKGMMKLNPTGWKRKRRDTLQATQSARVEDNRQRAYNLNQLINRLLVQKRQRMRFNPTGW